MLIRTAAVRLAPLASAALVLNAPAHAEEPADGGSAGQFDRITIVGSRDQAAVTAGAANFVSPEEIAQFKHVDVMRVLKRVPGVYVVEEEGFGLRPNVGIRGSGIDRNSRITVMEDGVLIAPAPYAAPSAYYFPTMQRMHAVEVRKGSASVRSGPRTTGGALNLISTPVPDEPFAGYGNFLFGEDSALLGHGHIGGTVGNWGAVLEGVHQETDGFKQLDGGGDTGYDLEDVLLKVRYRTEADAHIPQEFELKLGHTEQLAHETYMGLTDTDFAATPLRRYAASQLDNFDAEHDQFELRHYAAFSGGLDLTTVVYRNEFARNWYKVEQVGTSGLSAVLADPVTFSNEYAWLTGSTSPDDAIALRNNNRAYVSQGVQTILGWQPEWGGSLRHSLEVGLRYHEDEEDRFQDNDRYRMQDGGLVLTTDGAPGSQSNQLGEAQAFSFYLQDEIRAGAWIVTPGVRYESVDLQRTRWAPSDPSRAAPATNVVRSDVSEWIPGIGAVRLLDEHWSVLGSIHKGFNPPGPGSDIEPEESLNYELGVRYNSDTVLAELIGFHNDYDNLVGTCTVSTGGNCTIGDQFAGGEVRVQGVELGVAREWQLGPAITVPVRLSYTYTHAEFRSSFESDFEEWGPVQAGDSLPYLPPNQLQLGTALEASRWQTHLTAAYTDAMRVQSGSGPAPASLATDEHWVVDLAGSYDVTANISLFARVENLLDEEYIAARRPAGARPGRPRTGLVGFTARF